MPLPRPSTGLTPSRSGTDQRSALVVCGGHVGRSLAVSLVDDYDVTFVSTRPEVVDRADRDGLAAHHVETVDANSLERVGAGDASLAVAASGDDGTNLLAARLFSAKFGVEDVVLRVNDPERVDSFDDLDVTTVCVPDLLTAEVSTRLEAAADELAEP